MAFTTITVDTVFEDDVNFIKQGEFQYLTGFNGIIADNCEVTFTDKVFECDLGSGSHAYFEVINGGRMLFGECENLQDVKDFGATPIIINSCVIQETVLADRADLLKGNDAPRPPLELIGFYGGKLKGDSNVDVRSYDTPLELVGVDLENVELWSCWDVFISHCYIHDSVFAMSGVRGIVQNTIVRRVSRFADLNSVSGIIDLRGVDMEITGSLIYSANSSSTYQFSLIDCITNNESIIDDADPSANAYQKKTIEVTLLDAFSASLTGRICIEGETPYDLTEVTDLTEEVVFRHAKNATRIWTDSSAYTIKRRVYGYEAKESDLVVVQSLDFLTFLDPFVPIVVTESSKTIVNAYTDLENFDKIFDRAMAMQEDFIDTPTDFLVAEGSVINANAFDIVFDSGASSVIDLTGNILTFKSSSLSVGTNYSSIKSIGSLTSNVAAPEGVVLDGFSYITGPGIPNTATLTNSAEGIRITLSATLDFRNWTFINNTFDITLVDNIVGPVTILIGAKTVVIDEGLNNELIIDTSVLVDVVNENIVDLSRVRLYNVTKGIQLDNSIVSGGLGYSFEVDINSATASDGDTLRMEVAQIDGLTAMTRLESTGVVSTSGLTFLESQVDNIPYGELLRDGSLITGYSADFIDDEVDITLPANYLLGDLMAWWVYIETTEQGISDFFGGMDALSSALFRINNSVVDLYLDNSTAVNIYHTDNKRLFRVDGQRPARSITSGGGGLEVHWLSSVALANTDEITEGLDDILEDTNELQENQDNWLTATATIPLG